MKQQKSKEVIRPAKSLSAKNFFKMTIRDKSDRKKYNTLHTQPIETHVRKIATSRLQAKSRQNTLKTRQAIFSMTEQLHEDNIKLKGKVNKLTEQLMLQRVKRTQDTRHYTKMQRQVQIQFQDDRYLDVSRTQGKVIQGVKHQYQKMKQSNQEIILEYQQKCKEYNELLRRYEVSGGQEFRFQCEALMGQNKKLKNKLEVLLSTQERITKDYCKEKGRQYSKKKGQNLSKLRLQEQQILDLLGYSAQMVTLSTKTEDLQTINQRYIRKIIKLKALAESHRHKINFLDKLLNQKSNENHRLLMKERKTSRQNRLLNVTLEELRSRLERQTESRRVDLEYLKEKEKVKFETEKTIFVRSLNEKDVVIQKLREEMKYVTTLIQYLKLGDEQAGFQKSGLSFNPLAKKKSSNDKSQDLLHNFQMSLASINQPQAVRQRVKTLFVQNLRQTNSRGLRQSNNPHLHSNTQALKNLQISSQDQEIAISIKGSPRSSQNDDTMIQSRVVKKSHLKHHPDCYLIKPVKMGQLQSFKLQLMYRFIYFGISTDEAKGLLQFKISDQVNLSKRDIKWKSKYISMKQAKQKMMSHPFELNEEQATLLARYVIEDATKDDVFYHQENQIERAIAKSILRAFVGEYVLPDKEKAREEIKEVLASSGKNLNSALSSLAPSGTISWIKLMEISRGIQVQFTEQTWNFILSQLSFRSEGVEKLKYQLLFSNL